MIWVGEKLPPALARSNPSYVLSQRGDPFVEPGILAGIPSIVRQVLQFMGQHGQIGGAARLDVVQIHGDHGAMVALGIDVRWLQIGSGKVGAGPRKTGMQHGDAAAVRQGGASEHLVDGGVDDRVPRLDRRFQRLDVDLPTVLDPEADGLADGQALGLDLSHAASIDIGDPKRRPIPRPIGRCPRVGGRGRLVNDPEGRRERGVVAGGQWPQLYAGRGNRGDVGARASGEAPRWWGGASRWIGRPGRRGASQQPESCRERAG